MAPSRCSVTTHFNGTESRIGSLTADWGRYFEWKRIDRENEPRRIALEVMIRGTCEPTRLMDLVENFTLFSEHKSGLVKVIGQNHQYLGVNNAIAATLVARSEKHSRGGVFWQTQGSGKSFSMVFYSRKILRKLPGNWTFVIVTDRTELDDQIAKTFKACGAVSEAESKVCHAESGAHLRQLLRENHRYVFTLIHKFQTNEALCVRPDVIVLTDEAHRSQYDMLAINMRSALPNAVFLAFTGTPLIAGEERTREVFGDYVSIYDFQQSVEDGATVPLYYENRTPELKLKNPDLNEAIYALIEEAELSEEAEKRLERELGRQYHLITRDDRLEKVAKDIVWHFLGRGFQGKAMVVSIDKATALKMYTKVSRYWQEEKKQTEKEIASLTRKDPSLHLDRLDECRRRLEILKTTDMALVVSPGQNEIEQMKALGLDIVPHRKRIVEEELDEKFKDTKDPLRLVFVCAMWLTGFDAPSCSTIYLDKPMCNHTLMQTIARANRVFPGKHSGLIVDYANVFASLEKALAIYGKGRGGETPVRDKKQLVEELRKSVGAVDVFCNENGVSLGAIESASVGFAQAGLIEAAVEKLISPDSLRKDFLAHERLVRTLSQAVKPDPAVFEFLPRIYCLGIIASSIIQKINIGRITDITEVLGAIGKVLDGSVVADAAPIEEQVGHRRSHLIDLAGIDFEALTKRFNKSPKKKLEVEQLKEAIRAQLERMVLINRARIDYLVKFEALIEDYNSGSRTIEETFGDLVALSGALSEEQERHVRENLNEEELAIFDILTRPGPKLSAGERVEVKKVAKAFLEKLKTVLVEHWREKTQARAQVRMTVEDTLDDGLPKAYTPDVFKTKVDALFQHVYENYRDINDNTFTASA